MNTVISVLIYLAAQATSPVYLQSELCVYDLVRLIPQFIRNINLSILIYWN